MWKHEEKNRKERQNEMDTTRVRSGVLSRWMAGKKNSEGYKERRIRQIEG